MKQTTVERSDAKQVNGDTELAHHSFSPRVAKWASLAAIAVTLAGCSRGIVQKSDNLYYFPIKDFPAQLANFAATNTTKEVVSINLHSHADGCKIDYHVVTAPRSGRETEPAKLTASSEVTSHGSGVYEIGGKAARADLNLINFVKQNPTIDVRATAPLIGGNVVIVTK